MARSPTSSSSSNGQVGAGNAQLRREARWSSDIPETLVLEHFTSEERVSNPFVVRADVVAPGGAVDFAPHLGTGADIEVIVDGRSVRHFHGFLFSAEQTEEDEGATVRYRLELRPWIYFLHQTSHWRIFQNKTVVEVISEVVSEYGAGFNIDLDRLSQNYDQREYLCQFGETDYDFLSRLMEEEGIYYFFEHKPESHTLIACEGRGCHDSIGALEYRSSFGSDDDSIWGFSEKVKRVVSSALVTDYDFKKAKEKLEAQSEENNGGALNPGSVHDHPAEVFDPPGISKSSGLRLDGLRAERRLYDVQTSNAELTVGSLFNLTRHLTQKLNDEYLVVGSAFAFTNPGPLAQSGEATSELTLRLDAAPTDTAWRPARVTPKRIVRGPQTAVVVGPENEEIHTDEFGRVRVRFFWDRSTPPADRKGQDSCWMRVSQSWAGINFGEMFIPRVGHEVIVSFLDGDPERPIITGRVYNSENRTPINDKNKTLSGWKTRTAYGKSTQDYDGAVEPPTYEPGWNSVAFEDKSGEEVVFIHAHRDYRLNVLRDREQWIHRDSGERVGRNLDVEVQTGDETRKVTAGSRTTTINQKETLTVEQGDMSTTVSTGKQSTEVSKGDQSTDIKMGNQSTELGMGNQSITLKMGNQTTKLDLGKAETEAMQSIELKVGASSIKIDQIGVTIKGLMVTIEGTATLDAKAPMTQVNGNGMLTLKGGVTMIN